MEILYKICSRNNLVPGLEQIELTDNPTGTAHNLDRFKETFRRGYLGRALLDMVSEGGSTSDPLDLVDVSYCRPLIFLCTYVSARSP